MEELKASVLIRENRRTLAIKINEKGDLIVKAPKHLSIAKINNFIESKKQLINKKLELVKNRNNNLDLFNEYKFIYLLGKKYNICYENIKNLYINEEKKQIILPINKSDKEKTKLTIIKFYKELAKKIIPDQFEKYVKLFKKEIKSLKIVNSKIKWGSCDSENKLEFNWRTIILGENLIEYIFVHEFCHLIELNHSKKFWNLVKSFIPDYIERKEKIKKLSFLLKCYR